MKFLKNFLTESKRLSERLTKKAIVFMLNEKDKLSKEKSSFADKVIRGYAGASIVLTTPMMASADVFDRVESELKGVVVKLVTISTVLAVLATAIVGLSALTGDRDEQRGIISQLKRIWLIWFVLNTLGISVPYLKSLVQGAQYS